MALVFTSDTEPTGDTTTLPNFLHSAGVAGYSDRFLAKYATTSGGDATAIPSQVSGSAATLVPATSLRRPAVGTESGFQKLTFDAAATDYATATGLTAYRTIVGVFNMTSATGADRGVVGDTTGDLALYRSSGDGNIGKVQFPGTGSLAVATTPMTDWCVFGASWDGTNRKVWYQQVGGTAKTGSNASGSSDPAMTTIGIGQAFGAYGSFDFVELLTYPTALTNTDFAAIYAAMAAHYAALFV